MPTNAQILEARELFDRAMNGNLRARAEVMESLTTSDFPLLLGAAYAREVVDEYQSITPVWRQIATRRVLPDFRERNLVEIMGGRSALERVKEASEYPARKASASSKAFSIEKYGARFPLTWEMVKNDDLDAFRDFPQRLATAARETEEINALRPFFNVAGNGLSAWANAQANTATPLTKDNLNAGLREIAQRKDSDNRPIILPQPVLLLPTALEETANAIVSVTETTDPGTGEKRAGNGLVRTPRIVVDPWLDIVGANYSGISDLWVLMPPPSGAVKPHLVMGFLAGEENPDLRVKADTGNRLGGGNIRPEEGSFDDDTIQYRVRHVNGSAGLWNDAMYIGVG